MEYRIFLPPPFGGIGPKDLKRIIKEYKLPNLKRANWLCVSDFPNIPYYGNLTIFLENTKLAGYDVSEENKTLDDFCKEAMINSLPKVHTNSPVLYENIQAFQVLGTDRWRYPLVLSDMIQPPFSNIRVEEFKKPDCTKETATRLTDVFSLDRPNQIKLLPMHVYQLGT